MGTSGTGRQGCQLLIRNNCLEKLDDFEYKGKKILASRLGYRITKNFAFRCMNQLFDEPLAVFNERMLKPELQGMEDFVDGINNIVEAQQRWLCAILTKEVWKLPFRR